MIQDLYIHGFEAQRAVFVIQEVLAIHLFLNKSDILLVCKFNPSEFGLRRSRFLFIF